MSNKTLAEVRILPVDAKFQTVGLVTELKERRDKNNHPYWIMSVMDKSGTLEAKIWGNSQWYNLRGHEDVKREITNPSESPLVKELTGQTVGLIGLVSEFKGKTQYQFNQIWIVDQDKEEYRPSNFVRAAAASLEDMTASFRALIDGCKGEAGDFVRYVFREDGEIWEIFKNNPAAVTHHHAYVHGLIEHTLGVTRSAHAIAGSYRGGEYEPDIDIVTAGAALHDIGKIDTYALTPGPESTLEGTILDHIATGYARFTQMAKEFGLSEPMKLHLGHIILSHHGQKEFGSPILPATPEAMIVAAADNLDFTINSWQGAVKLLDGGTEASRSISEYDFSTQRRLWKWRPVQPR